MNESERQELDYLREHHEQTHHAAAKYELLVDYLSGKSVAIPPNCPVFAEIERLRTIERVCGNVLSVLNGDGGQHIDKVGWKQAGEDGLSKHYDLMRTIDNLRRAKTQVQPPYYISSEVDDQATIELEWNEGGETTTMSIGGGRVKWTIFRDGKVAEKKVWTDPWRACLETVNDRLKEHTKSKGGEISEASQQADTLMDAVDEISKLGLVVNQQTEELHCLRARVAELEMPYAYWCDLDESTSYADPKDFLVGSDFEPGHVIEFQPVHMLPLVWYVTVPDMDAGQINGAWSGICKLVGPYTSKVEALEEARRVIEARLAEMGSAEQNEQGGNQ